MMDMQRVYLGTELKLNVNIGSLGGLTMDNYDFVVELSCTPKNSVLITKANAKRVDENNYIVCVDTRELGVGKLTCSVKASIPDGDFDDGFRTEIAVVNTNIHIVKVG